MNYSVLHPLVKKNIKNYIWCLNNLWFDCICHPPMVFIDLVYLENVKHTTLLKTKIWGHHIYKQFYRNDAVKGTVHPKMKLLSSFTHPQVDPNLYECVCSAEHKGRYSEEWGKQSIFSPTMEVNGAPKQPDYKLSSKYLPLCSEQTHSYRFGTTWGRVNDDRSFIFGWTVSLRSLHTESEIFICVFSSPFPIKMLATDAKMQKIESHPNFFYDGWRFQRQCGNVIDTTLGRIV